MLQASSQPSITDLAALLAEGEAQARLAQHSLALETFRNILDAANEEDAATQWIKARALLCRGRVYNALSQGEQARESFLESIELHERLLREDRDPARNVFILLSLGRLHAGVQQHEEAISYYGQAADAARAALRERPGDVEICLHGGSALASLGRLQSKLGDNAQAAMSFRDAVSFFDQAGSRGLTGKAGTLLAWGRLEAGENGAEAVKVLAAAATVYEEILTHASGDVMALRNLANTLVRMGDLQSGMSQFNEAEASYKRSITYSDLALVQAPDSADARANKGCALMGLGRLQSGGSGSAEEAVATFRQALEEFSRALEIAPSNEQVRSLREDLVKVLEW